MVHSQITYVLFAIISLFAMTSNAEEAHSSAHSTAQTNTSATAVHKASGTVNKLNTNGSVNITHGPVASLKWPAMTMDLKVKDQALLTGLKPGQKINFEIGMGPAGYVITAISLAK